MELRLVDSRPEFAPPAFLPPPASGFLHVAAAVAPPTGPPFVRRNARRAALLRRLATLGAELSAHPAVRAVTVYRAVLVPPVAPEARRPAHHPARYDVVTLVETSSQDDLAEVAETDAARQLVDEVVAAAPDVHVMRARCLRSLGEVERSRTGLYLFNYFSGDDPARVAELWEHLAGWYVRETGLDNSTLLAPLGAGDYPIVNHARWDKSLLRLAAEQFSRPSFHTYVRGNLRANDVIAMPVLYRLAATFPAPRTIKESP